MRIVFMGTPEFAVPSLDALVAAGHQVVAVYTQPPRPAGRGKGLRPSPVQQRAEAMGLSVFSPARLKDVGEQIAFASHESDVAVVAAYGLILPHSALDAPRLGCINVHASLLPRWRGAAPVQRAILAGDTVSGVTVMQMEAGLDTGPMLLRRELSIGGMTAGQATAALAALGAVAMVEVLRDPAAFPPVPQPSEHATYATKVDKAESRIDFNLSAVQVERQVRAFAPVPGAWFEHAGERIRVLAAEVAMTPEAAPPGTILDGRTTIACNPGGLRPLLVQRAGRAAMPISALMRGFALPTGTRLA